jgi:hypothetical protein
MTCQGCVRRGASGNSDLPPKKDRHGKAHCPACGAVLRIHPFTQAKVATLIKAVREEKLQCPVRAYTKCSDCTNPVCKALRVFDYMT